MTIPDSRPRAAYTLPDGRIVRIIFDHGQEQPTIVSYTQADGSIVLARRKPITPQLCRCGKAIRDGRALCEACR